MKISNTQLGTYRHRTTGVIITITVATVERLPSLENFWVIRTEKGTYEENTFHKDYEYGGKLY